MVPRRYWSGRRFVQWYGGHPRASGLGWAHSAGVQPIRGGSGTVFDIAVFETPGVDGRQWRVHSSLCWMALGGIIGLDVGLSSGTGASRGRQA